MIQHRVVTSVSGGDTSTDMDLNQYLDTIVVSKNLITQADDLALEHERFHDHYVIGGRAALYTMLQKIYELVLKMETSQDRHFFVQQMRKTLKSKYGIRTQENSTPAAVVVRYITRADRKTAHVYARAIEVAIESQVPTLGFSEFLEEQGGVEKIRANNANHQQTAQSDSSASTNLAYGVTDYLDSKSEFPIASFHVREGPANSDCDDFEVFVCRKRHGRYLVLNRLKLGSEHDLEAVLKDGLSNELEEFNHAPQKFISKALGIRQKRQFKLLKKHNPKYVTQVRNALGKNRIGLLTPSARLAWVQTLQMAKCREKV